MKIKLLFLPILIFTGFLQAEDYHYTLTWEAPHTHTYLVEVSVKPQTETYTDFCLPAWRPGRYILQDYAAAIFNVRAPKEGGGKWQIEKMDKDTWRVHHDAQAKQVSLVYNYLANNEDAGSSYLAEGQVYFNPVNLFMYVPGRLDGSVYLHMPQLETSWKAATALIPTENAQTYTASSYHEFADCPSVFAPEMKQLSFEDKGTSFYIHLQGNYQGDGAVDEAIVDMVRRVCSEQRAIFGSYPFETYHFIYRLLDYNMRHAVEHSNSASFVLPATVTSRPERVIGSMAGITAHEFFHAWNVKRIRPAAMWPYDYSKPQYTHQHWFTEGVTDYYANLTLVRAGLVEETKFWGDITRTVQRLENSYAASVISPAQASFDSWLATSPYAHPDHRISYYTLGWRIGLFFDLTLRTQHDRSLDDLMRFLYKKYYEQDKGVPETGIQEALEEITSVSWEKTFEQLIFGTGPFDYEPLFDKVGLVLNREKKKQARLNLVGITAIEKLSQGWLIQRMHNGGAAYQSGLAVNDLILEINGKRVVNLEDEQLDELLSGLSQDGDELMMTVFRQGNLEKFRIPYGQGHQPMVFQLSRDARIKAKKERKLNEWIASQVKAAD